MSENISETSLMMLYVQSTFFFISTENFGVAEFEVICDFEVYRKKKFHVLNACL